MGTHGSSQNIAITRPSKELQSDTYNDDIIATQQLDHTQPIDSPNLRTSPAHPGPDADAVADFIGPAIFRRPGLVATGLWVCTSCTLCTNRFSILRRQS